MNLSLQHIHLRSKDKMRLAQWYCDRLGFRVVGDIEKLGEVDGPVYLSGDDGITGMTIFTRETPSNNPFPAFGTDADGFVRAWEKTDRPRVYNHYYFYSLYIEDPEQNRIEICCTDVPSIQARLEKEKIEAFLMSPETYTPPK